MKGCYPDMTSYEMAVYEELYEKAKELLLKESQIAEQCKQVFERNHIDSDMEFEQLSVYADEEKYPDTSLRVELKPDVAYHIEDYKEACESLFADVEHLAFISFYNVELSDVIGFYTKSEIDGRIMSSECSDDELLELLYSIRTDNYREEWRTNKDEAILYILKRLGYLPDTDYKCFISQPEYGSIINLNFTQDMTQEQINKFPVVTNVLMALIPDLYSVDFRYPFADDEKHEIVCEFEWNRTNAKEQLGETIGNEDLVSLEAFQDLITRSQEYTYDDYVTRDMDNSFIDRDYVDEYLTSDSDKIEYGEMTYDDETIARLETLIDNCLDYKLEGISIFNSDADYIAEKLGVPKSRISNSDGSLIGACIDYDGISIMIDDEYGYISVDEIPEFTTNVPDEIHFYSGQNEKEVFENFGLSREEFKNFYYEYDTGSIAAYIDRLSDDCDHITLSKRDENLGTITFVVDSVRDDEGWKVENMNIQITNN